MEISFIEPDDVVQIYNIYCNFFSDMEFIDFYNHFYSAFKVTNSGMNNKIVAVGGLRPIAEAVVLTNKDFSVRDRRDALLKLFEGIKYTAEKAEFKQIHAFAYDEEYIKHLVDRMGFKCNPENRVLSLDLKNGQKETT